MTTPATVRVTIRRYDDPVLRWHAIIEHCPEQDPASEIPRGCVESPSLFAFTRAGIERKVRRCLAKYERAEVAQPRLPAPRRNGGPDDG